MLDSTTLTRYPDRKLYINQCIGNEFCNRSTDSRRYTERRKKTVRFNSEGWNSFERENLEYIHGLIPSQNSGDNVSYDDGITDLSSNSSSLMKSIQRSSNLTCPAPSPSYTSKFFNHSFGGVGNEKSYKSRTSHWMREDGRFKDPTQSLRIRKDPWDIVERQGSQDSHTKDSGIDSGTSSNFNSSEDSCKGEMPRISRVRDLN